MLNIIIGWVLWTAVCIWAVCFFIAAIVLHRKRHNLGLLLFRLIIVVGNVISLIIPIAFNLSKLHLIWLVPASFAVALLLLPITAILGAGQSGRY
jgi:hypothetical protein